MDVFMEYMVKKQKDGKDMAVIGGIVALGLFITLAVFYLILYFGAQGVSFAFSLGFILVVFMWYGAWVLITRRNIEWEYILTNSALDIDKIMAKKGRKRVLSVDLADAALIANIEDNDHNHAYKNAHDSGTKIMDFTGSKTFNDVYFIDIQVDGERRLVLFQPTSKMISEIKKFNPRNVFMFEKPAF